MKIGILYDAGSGNWDARDVEAVLENAATVRGVLRRGGYETTMIPVALGDVRWLQRVQQTDAVFNLCEGVSGLARYEDFAVAALDLARVPYTGATSWTVTIAHRKHVANTLLDARGIPVPPFELVRHGRMPKGLRFPVIVKPAAEDASVGIDGGAVCSSQKALRERLAKAATMWDEVMVQEYVPGREVNVAFIGEEVLPISEIVFGTMPDGTWPIVTYDAKWATGSDEDLATVPVCPADLSFEVRQRVELAAREAWALLGEQIGYGRVDIRIAADGLPYVLEVNPNPDISEDAGLARMAAAHGWDYDALILKVLDEALERAERRWASDQKALKLSA